jgi:trimethylamine--corrinoid protein Co-methyltransferase
MNGAFTAKGERVRPILTVLDDEQIAKVHDYSLQVLSSVGVRIDSVPVRQLLGKAAGPGAVDGDRVYIPRELVHWALQTAPATIKVYERRGDMSFELPGQTRFGIGVTALYYQDPQNDQVTPFTRRNMEQMVRLGGMLSSFDVISTVGVVQDVRAEVSDLYATLEMTANTVKPLVLLVSREEAFPAVLGLLEHLHGDLSSRPFVLPYFSPISPLVINKGTADKMFLAAEWGLPFIYSNYGMAGASSPITPAGSLVLLNAELLAGLTLSQLIKEGNPVILGSLPAFFDMKGMGSFYDPQSYVVDLACAEMMAHYRVPHCGTSGSGMGWGADLIAGGHQWMNHLVSCIGRIGLAPFVGDNLGSKVFSPSIAVYANEVIQQARLFAQGFALNDTTVGLDEILLAGPGGSFLASNLTLKHFRKGYYRSDIFPRLTLEEWMARERPDAGKQLRFYTQQLLSNTSAPDDHADLLAKGEAYIGRCASQSS